MIKNDKWIKALLGENGKRPEIFTVKSEKANKVKEIEINSNSFAETFHYKGTYGDLDFQLVVNYSEDEPDGYDIYWDGDERPEDKMNVEIAIVEQFIKNRE